MVKLYCNEQIWRAACRLVSYCSDILSYSKRTKTEFLKKVDLQFILSSNQLVYCLIEINFLLIKLQKIVLQEIENDSFRILSIFFPCLLSRLLLLYYYHG
jgi:hypothetical protein